MRGIELPHKLAGLLYRFRSIGVGRHSVHLPGMDSPLDTKKENIMLSDTYLHSTHHSSAPRNQAP